MDQQEISHAVQVRIVNRNEFDIRDRYDGVWYLFPGSKNPKEPSKPALISPQAAGHIFGYRPWPDVPEDEIEEAMITYCAKRHGWNTSAHHAQGLHRRYWENIEITPVRMRLVEEPADTAQRKG